MPKKVLHEVDLLANAKPVKEAAPKKRKAKEPVSPPPSDAELATKAEIVPNVVEGTDQVKVKKPRTEKQLAADAKRREAALQKKKEKEEEERKIKEAEVAAFEAAELKKKLAAEKRKAAREAKKAAQAEALPQSASAGEEDEDEIQMPIASSVPQPKEPVKRQKKIQLVVEKELVKPKVRPQPEEPRQEALPDQNEYRKKAQQVVRKRAPMMGNANRVLGNRAVGPTRQRLR